MSSRTMQGLRFGVIGLLIGLLSACSSAPPQGQGASSSRPSVDGAPDYLMDVSKIPDAVPTVHTGPFKASPYRVLGRDYTPMQDGRHYREEGEASWYGTKFHGQKTANGELYDLYGMTAAHKTLPLPTYVQVTNLANDRTIVVRVNDRGPFYSDRIIDLSYAAARKLGFAEKGTARVRVEGIDPVAWHQQRDPAYLVTARAAKPEGAPQSASSPASMAGDVYLQVGAFASAQSAERLRAQLQSQTASPVFLSTTENASGTLHRVRIGPMTSHDQAEQLADVLRRANLGTPAVISGN